VADGFFVLTLLLMGLEWFVVATRCTRWRIITKPAPMVSLIFWFTLVGKWQGGLVWFGIALVFSLMGDIFLLFPFRFFLPGLIAFSLAHIFYITGFNLSAVELKAGAWLITLIFLLVAVFDFAPIIRKVSNQPSRYKLLSPVMFYAIIISLMLLSAWFTLARPGWNGTAVILVILGASLFFISDSLLAREKFIRPAKFGGLAVMVTYLLAQLLITSGALIHFSGRLRG
jgi:uncharacterized membrane protein YhhN